MRSRRHAANQARYVRTAKGREANRRYDRSEKGKLRSARWKQGLEGGESVRRNAGREAERIKADPERYQRRLAQDRTSRARRKFEQNRAIVGHPVLLQKAVVLSDVQLPWEDPAALGLALKFIAWYKPDTVILNGDITDCYAMSQFHKDPLNIMAAEDEYQKMLALLRELKSVPQKIWLGGNHEDRWRKILWREAGTKGGLSPIVTMLLHGMGLDRFDVDESWRRIFRVKELGVTYWPYGHYVEVAEGNLIITHGFLVSMHSGYSAKRHYERLGTSCLIGHTHRLGSFLVTQMWNPKGAWENGCLCRLDPEYVQFPNWQQGFSVVTVSGRAFHVEQIPILPDYTVQYQGQVFHHDGSWKANV